MTGLSGARIYLDANALIYFTEAHPTLGPPLKSLFAFADDGNCRLVSSELTLAEVLVLSTGAALRARRELRLPDALHLASATAAGCDLVVTADVRLRPEPPLALLPVDSIMSKLPAAGPAP
jgi:predicted nucleic acid-binding protein